MMVLLVIMDGWGLRDPLADNAITSADTPVYNSLKESAYFCKLDGSGLAVGLPQGQMGNSEVGHLNLGAGRVVYQDITRIDKSISEGDFFTNEVLTEPFEKLAKENKNLHLFGLVSDGKVHSSMDHLYALVELAKQKNVPEVYLHAFTDGRDTSPTSGVKYIEEVLQKFNEIGLGKIASISGRYYGMDRDRRWERTDKAYQAIVHGEGVQHSDPIKAVKQSYENDVTDEFIIPVVISSDKQSKGLLTDGDLAMMFNFRSDRMRQLAYLFSGHKIEGYDYGKNPEVKLITMTNYDKNLINAKIAYQPITLYNILGEVLANNNLKQLRTAETEKYAHVTFFFNGGVEQPFDGEDRDLIPSPKVATYDLKPEMSSVEVTDNAVEKINSGKYSFVLLNYANCDMVGHTGDQSAAQKAVEAVDKGVGRLLEAVKEQDGVAIITADHGNAEMMLDPKTGGPWTAHTTNLVPCFVYDPSNKLPDDVKFREIGVLADIAPTVLELLNIKQPIEMTGKSIIEKG